jgi:hypothetical protein
MWLQTVLRLQTAILLTTGLLLIRTAGFLVWNAPQGTVYPVASCQWTLPAAPRRAFLGGYAKLPRTTQPQHTQPWAPATTHRGSRPRAWRSRQAAWCRDAALRPLLAGRHGGRRQARGLPVGSSQAGSRPAGRCKPSRLPRPGASAAFGSGSESTRSAARNPAAAGWI